MSSLQNWLSAGSLTSASARFSRSGCVRIRWSSACTTTSESGPLSEGRGKYWFSFKSKTRFAGSADEPQRDNPLGAGLVRNEREARKGQSVTFSLAWTRLRTSRRDAYEPSGLPALAAHIFKLNQCQERQWLGGIVSLPFLLRATQNKIF